MITDSAIKAALRNASPLKPIVLSDGGARGEGRLQLVVRGTPGRVTAEWYAVWHRHRRRKSTKIGNYPTLSVGDARREFRAQYLPQIAKGESPAGPRIRKAFRGVTTGDMFDAYVEDLRARGKASADEVERILNNAAADLGKERPAASIQPKDISGHLKAIHKRGAVVMAATTRSYISSAFAFALKSANSYTNEAGRDWGLTANPVEMIPVDPQAFRVGDRHLSPEEVKPFWRWLEEQEEEARSAAALRLIIAMGQRVTEVLRLGPAARSDGLLDWSKTKNGRPHTIPESLHATAILDGLNANYQGLYFWNRNRPVLPMTKDAPAALVRAYVDETKCQPFTPRDLRRTWKTLSGAAGISKDMRDRLQNHARTDVSSRHYDRYEYLPEKREAVKRWDDYLGKVLA